MAEESRESETSALGALFSGWKGIVFGVAIVAVLATFYHLVFPRRFPSTAESSACLKTYLAFLEHVKAGRFEEAYALTTPAFQKRYAPAAFEQFVKEKRVQLPEGGHSGGFTLSVGRPPLEVKRHFDRRLADGSIEHVVVLLVGEGESWLVDDVSVGPKPK